MGLINGYVIERTIDGLTAYYDSVNNEWAKVGSGVEYEVFGNEDISDAVATLLADGTFDFRIRQLQTVPDSEVPPSAETTKERRHEVERLMYDLLKSIAGGLDRSHWASIAAKSAIAIADADPAPAPPSAETTKERRHEVDKKLYDLLWVIHGWLNGDNGWHMTTAEIRDVLAFADRNPAPKRKSVEGEIVSTWEGCGKTRHVLVDYSYLSHPVFCHGDKVRLEILD